MAHRESHLTVNPQGSGWRSTAYGWPAPGRDASTVGATLGAVRGERWGSDRECLGVTASIGGPVTAFQGTRRDIWG